MTSDKEGCSHLGCCRGRWLVDICGGGAVLEELWWREKWAGWLWRYGQQLWRVGRRRRNAGTRWKWWRSRGTCYWRWRERGSGGESKGQAGRKELKRETRIVMRRLQFCEGMLKGGVHLHAQVLCSGQQPTGESMLRSSQQDAALEAGNFYD